MGRRRSRSRSRRRRDSSASHDDKDDASSEAKIALLEVEVETLKAENRELKKKLVEVLRRPDRRPDREGRGDDAKKNTRAAEENRESRRKETMSEKDEGSKDKAESGGSDEGLNAVLLCNTAQEAYNEPVPNNIALEKRLPLVNGKLERFLNNFSDSVQILDLNSGKAIVKDKKTFVMRYSCVFRESGANLKCTINKRFYYDDSHKRPTFCLDYEVHQKLVTAMAGTPPDGKLGVREPRTEHLVALYEEKGGRITRMWLRPDTEKIGLDPTAGEETLTRTEIFKVFEAKIAELKGGAPGPRIFHNYLEMPTVG